MSTDSVYDFDTLLDTNYLEIPNLPKYAPFPSCVVKLRGLKVELTPKKGDIEAAFQLTFELLEVVDPGPEDQKVSMPEIGSFCGFKFSGAKGVQKFKELFFEVLEKGEYGSPRALLEQFDGLEMFAELKSRSYINQTNEVAYSQNIVRALLV